MEKEKGNLVYLARLAEQAERYDGVVSIFLNYFFEHDKLFMDFLSF